MTALPLYIYSPLDEEASEIRLMTLHPSERAWSKICVTLENHVLREGETPPYEALSYTWGTPKWPLKIFVQGDQNASLNVTQNLESALRHLRYADRPRVMWIDATCVDQQNLEERSQQVKRMADVFRLAGRVLIWLGPEADDSTLALRTLADVGSKVTADWTAQMMAPKGDADDEWIDPKFDFPFDNNTWTAINALLYRPWFERLWIWQEVRFASKDTIMVCGQQCIEWNKFRNAMMCLDKKSIPAWVGVAHLVYKAFTICNYRQYQDSLSYVLGQTAHCKCSDERDRVFAVLNMTDSSEIVGLDSDYSKTCEEVYQNLVTMTLKHRQNLWPLTYCELENKALALPSWVPDLSVTPRRVRDRTQNSCINSAAYACYDSDGGLEATGVYVARILKLEPMPSFSEMGLTESDTAMAEMLRTILGSVLNTTNYVGGGSMLEAMCYTFCKGIFSEYYIPLDPNCLVFQDLKKLMKSLARVQGDIPQETISANERTLEYVSKECQGASFAVTREGYIGLVPSNSIIGDQICVLLGCQSPLVLRKSGVKDYLLVGECYVYGVSQGAALLGPLSGGWQAVLRYDQEAEGYYRAFINDDTGAVQMEDPRIGPLPDGWRVASHTYQDAYDLYATDSTGEEPTRFDPRMSPEALRERGVKLEEFRLV